ncbi:MAG: hypothetical protein NT069_10295 [Planctomycetota bacterium]|nr:hypothetical protein [Planctomycetota bacterium]
MSKPETVQDPLSRLVRDRKMQARLDAATLIRDYPVGAVRTAAAELFIRETMYDFSVGAIGADDQRQILKILAFAIPARETIQEQE